MSALSTQTTGWLLVGLQGLLLLGVFAGPTAPALTTSNSLRSAGNLFEIVGVALIAISAIELGRRLTAHPIPNGRGSLYRSGLYRFVRHPMYTGVMTVAIGATLANSSIVRSVSASLLIMLFNVKARFEERSLAAHFPEYPTYAATTGRFLPVSRRQNRKR